MILASPEEEPKPRFEWDVDTLRLFALAALSGDDEGDSEIMEELAYARDSFGMLGRRALFSVRFQARVAMLVGVFGVVGRGELVIVVE